VIYLCVLVTTRENPLQKERGMSFRIDVVDWLGGFPYEYATVDEILDFMRSLGFQADRVTRPRVPTGCNEFVLRHIRSSP
jgi:2-polyprenyl-6-hydroxyphenyl methylase/3-demethylubiquinone-9 3-methyltransferase